MKHLLISIAISIILNTIQAQSNFPKDYFRAPVDIKMTLSGTFAELRTNHFHSGIDIKTGGKTGEKIYAIADAYVSRIKISGTGFGKTLYLRHPNGFTSVYAHLNSFTAEIDTFIRKQQYEKQSFEINFYPKKDQFQFKKGDLIAYSGNSGGSEGPHLHFELRDSKSEHPLNPLLFGFNVKDFIRPKIKAVKLYAVDNNSRINGKNQSFTATCGGWGENYYLKRKDTLEVAGNIAFGINTYDLLNDVPNKNGVYSIQLYIDSALIYAHHMEEFSYTESRYINSFIDYAFYITKRQRFQRSLLDPNNHLSIYDSVSNSGLYYFDDTLIHAITYEVRDAYNNLSKLSFLLKSGVPDEEEEMTEPKSLFCWDKENEFKNEDIIVRIPPNALYKDIQFTYEKLAPKKNFYSPVHAIHLLEEPLHKYYELKIKAIDLPEKLYDKAIIAELSNNKPVSVGGKYEDGFVRVLSRNFGKFAIVTDTKKPEITALNVHSGKHIKGYKSILFRIKDDLSGIKSYTGKINGQWALFEFDPKNDKLTYYLDHLVKEGENILELEVEDGCNNIQKYSCHFTY